MAVLAALGAGIASGWLPITAEQVADGAGYLLLVVTVVFFAWLFFAGNWTPRNGGGSYVIVVFFLAAALFWSVFEQAGSTLNLFADAAPATRCSATRSRAAGTSR